MERPEKLADHEEIALTAAGAVGLTAAGIAAGWAATQVAVDARFLVAAGSSAVPALAAIISWGNRSGQAMIVIALWTVGAALTCALFGWATAPLILAPILAAVATAGRTDLVAACGFSLMAGVAGYVASKVGFTPAGGALDVAFTAAALVQVGALAVASAWRSRKREAEAIARTEQAERRAAEAANLLATKLSIAEAQAEETRALADGRARFLAEMSHELRTPLNAIIGFADAMRSRLFGPLSQRYGEYADLIHRSGRHLMELVGDVLDLSRIDAGRFELVEETFDASGGIADALDIIAGAARDSGVALVKPNLEPILINADRRAFRQMLLNLLSNAVKFTPSGFVVAITAAHDMELLTVNVVDTGVGIPPEQLGDLGRPFQQAANQPKGARGVGLGLSLVQRLAELHKGKLILESKLGEGTKATLLLPVIIAQSEA